MSGDLPLTGDSGHVCSKCKQHGWHTRDCPTAQPTQPLTGDELATIRARAEAASPSPWHYGDVESVAGGMLYDETRTIANLAYEHPDDHDGRIVRHLLSSEADANGAHIAGMDPATTLRLVAEIERLQAQVERVERLGDDWDASVGDRDEMHPRFRVQTAIDELHAALSEPVE